ncbi:hypothetical protein BMAJHU_B0520 [Burkholderia mallei JHU]|nr:hypothetical protein BMAFMH_B0532 [Burkholderia mallei FMH]EDK59590.1 hypothetical protein BMAJHU_B0520 [Burkholderia mallei JHU]
MTAPRAATGSAQARCAARRDIAWAARARRSSVVLRLVECMRGTIP